MPLHPVYDLNTSLETVDGTAPGEWYTPLRRTITTRDTIRVNAWLTVSTRLGTYSLGTAIGVDYEFLLDPATSDAERTAHVAEVIAGVDGVTGFVQEPVVTVVDDGQQLTVSIDSVVLTIDGSFTLTT